MAEQKNVGDDNHTYRGLLIAIGVWWFVWGVKGFWWGALYGLGWPVWLGYRVAEYALKVR